MDKIWKDIPNYEGLYRISSYGDIYSVRADRLMTPEIMNKGGYLRIGLNKNGTRERIMIHRLVMYTFVEFRNYPDWEVNHKDMNTQNNRLDNLEWVTLLENNKHSFLNNKNKSKTFAKNMSKIGKEYGHIGAEASKKRVARVDKDTNEIIQIYESAREASRNDGFSYKGISKVCHGGAKTHMGYKWKLLD